MSKKQEAVIFPGQGSQVKGMGRDVAEQNSEARELWLYAEKKSGLPLREIYWDGEETDMADTKALQPALTVVALTLWLMACKKIKSTAFAGHSLGEYAALAAARVLDIKTTLHLVSLRGKLMAEAGAVNQGMMALLKLSEEEAKAVVKTAGEETGQTLLVANYNTPAQFVISGEDKALQRASVLAKEKKGRAVQLAVSGAFHSPLVAEAGRELEKELKKAHWDIPTAPVYFNATAGTEKDPAAICTLMCSQMTSSVRWIEIMHNIYAAGSREFIEVGPKGVLTKMVGQNLKAREEKDWTAINLDSLESIGLYS